MATASMTDDRTSFQSDNSLDNISSLFGALKTPPPRQRDDDLEYLFQDEYSHVGPSWGARICYGAGMTYLTGLVIGGSWGLLDGLRNPAGRTTRLRLNCILNSCTARGPFVANNLAMVALLYNLIHGGIIKLRDGQSDLYTSAGSATLAGMIYKGTRGVKMVGLTGAAFGTGMLAFQLAKNYYMNRSIINM
jgi:import inner membrane translocase subunit TIM23